MKDIPRKFDSTAGGLHQRYNVTKLEGQTDSNAIYFVLRVDGFGGDQAHIRACQEAALRYAECCDNPRLASDLVSLVAYHRGILAAREVQAAFAGGVGGVEP